MPEVKLTSLSAHAGCAAKVAKESLLDLLRGLPTASDPNWLVGSATGDDAGVYRIGPDLAVVQTVDFFTPVVDDPYTFGQIAAANALSDVWAMGGRPITAMVVAGMPTDRLDPPMIRRIFRGGAARCRSAGVCLVGGHTIKLPEPVYGLSVTGLVDPSKMTTNAAAASGDLLVLTKPLGTGIVTTAAKRGVASAAAVAAAVRSMRSLNTVGYELAEQRLVRAATDVTGFGLIGHLSSMCDASGVGAEIDAAAVPVLTPELARLVEAGCVPGGSRVNRSSAEESVDWGSIGEFHRTLLTDAQTSGGLLLCVAPDRWPLVQQTLAGRTPSAAVVGRIVPRQQDKAIRVI